MQVDELQHLLVDALDDLKARDIVSLDVTQISSMTDRMVIATGNSKRQVSSLARHLVDRAREAGVRAIGTEGEQAGEWVLVDFGDVVVHIMQDDIRHFYQLERLWGEPASDDEQSVASSG